LYSNGRIGLGHFLENLFKLALVLQIIKEKKQSKRKTVRQSKVVINFVFDFLPPNKICLPSVGKQANKQEEA
jgi:hypothetical protein